MPRITIRRATAATAASNDVTLAEGEPGWEKDTNVFKIGDGSTAWTGLPSIGGGASVLDDLTDVNAPSPTDQYVLTWDDMAGEWIAAPAAGGAPTGSAGGDLSGTYPNPSVVNSSHDHDATTAPGDPHTALRAVDFLVGTTTAELSGEIAVGATPGGELGGTWASPTVDATHSGSAHHTEDHDHDGSPTQKLLQANTHETPDTDTGTSSLHHTIGTSATQAAAGNHTHAGGSVATDTIWDAAGDLAVGTGADTASKLSISVPAANVLNVLGVVNGETTWSVKAVHDSTNPAALGAAAPGTALTAAHRDHVHPTTGLVTSGTKISALTADTSPTTDDLIVTVNDPGGTPATRKVTIANLITLEGSANNPAALGTAAPGTSGNKLSRDDHVHPTTGLVTTTADVTAALGSISIADTNYVTLASSTFTIAAGSSFHCRVAFLVTNASGGTKTYTLGADVNGLVADDLDGGTVAASNTAVFIFEFDALVVSTSLAYVLAELRRSDPVAANTSNSGTNANLRKVWNTTASNLTGSGVAVRARIKSSANTATQTAIVLSSEIRQMA